jgi:hypothetical protein
MGMYVEENGPGVIKVGFYGWLGSFYKWLLVRRRRKEIANAAQAIRKKFRCMSHSDKTFWYQIEFVDDYEEYLASKTNVAFSFDEVLKKMVDEFKKEDLS